MKMSKLIAVMLLALLALANIGYSADIMEGDVRVMFNNSDLRQCEPASFDLEAAIDKGLGADTGFSDEYFHLQAFYAEGIWAILDARCQIMEVDQALSDSGMGFLPRKTPINVYQAHWSFGASYLFLRSNVHIERLSAGELDECRALAAAGDAASEECSAFILGTLRKVICIYPDLENDAVEAVYELSGLLAPNNAIVLGLATSPAYDENGNYVSAAAESEKRTSLEQLVEKTEPVMEEILGVPVRIFLY